MKCQRCGRFGTEANPMYQSACADPWWKGGGAHFNVQVCEECGGNAVLKAAMTEHEEVCPERLPKGYSPLRRWLRQERARENLAILSRDNERMTLATHYILCCDMASPKMLLDELREHEERERSARDLWFGDRGLLPFRSPDYVVPPDPDWKSPHER